ncbi:MAG: radical SAM protein [Planctomycetes bacterium]|nr:radical SAM protein [Planctomycetota bacterium]
MDSPLSPLAPLPPLQELTHAELATTLRAAGDEGARSTLAEAVMREVYVRATGSIEAMASIGAARRALLARAVAFPRLACEAVEPAADGSTRFAFRLRDGARIESVLLPHHAGSDRHTVCVSSQAGCAQVCRFCATGRLGLTRDLEAWEIVDQVVQVAAHARVRASDIVFMGMGEPLANEVAVYRAARVMTQSHGLQIGARRITISTAGVVPAIHRFIDDAQPFRLVFSLGCADPAKRRRLMPIQERHGFEEFIAAIARYEAHRGHQHVTLEYVAIRNFTMGDDDIAALAALARRGFRFLLNVIPFNPVGDEFEAPTMAEVRAWTSRLRPFGLPVKLRFSGGRDRCAGCGQLGTGLIGARRRHPDRDVSRP